MSRPRDYPVLIPYQVDCHTTTAGKHIRQTKRHVNWRFGFAHIPSILAGKQGVACRGMELDIHLIWSITSSKHILYVNDVIVHQAVASSSHLLPSQRFEHSFIIPQHVDPSNSGGHVVHITAWALGIGSKAQFDQQFILTLDGQRYNDFYPIFALGSPSMKSRYAKALARAENILKNNYSSGGGGDPPSVDDIYSRGAGAGSQSQSQTYASAPVSAPVPAADILGDRPRRKMNHQNQNPIPNLNQIHNVYRPYPQPSAPPRPGMIQRTSSDPDILGGYGSGYDRLGVSTTQQQLEEEERKLVAQARLNSLRDLRNRRDQEQSGMYARSDVEEVQYMTQARIRSFRDMRYTAEHGHSNGPTRLDADDDTIPTFARPPPSPRRTGIAAMPRAGLGLQPLQEDATVDLLDMDDNHGNSSGVGPPSAVTIDTTIQSIPADDEISTFSHDVYSHLDPNQMWKTQQNVSFRLQRPPVYSDTAAGDLISTAGTQSFVQRPMPMPAVTPSPQQQQQQQQRGMSYATAGGAPRPNFAHPNVSGTGMPMQTQTQTRAAPPPTWDSLNAAYTPGYVQQQR